MKIPNITIRTNFPRLRQRFRAVALGLMVSLPAFANGQYVLIPIPEPPAPVSPSTLVIADDGSLAMGGGVEPTFQPVSLLYERSQWVYLPSAGVNDLNASGTTVGRNSSIGGWSRSPQGDLTFYGSLNPQGVGNDGTIVGYFFSGGSNHGFIAERNGSLVIDYPGANATFLTGVNAHGTTVGSYIQNGVIRAFSRDKFGNFSELDVLGAVNTEALGINGQGTIVGRFYDALSPNYVFAGPLGFVCEEGHGITIIDASSLLPATVESPWGTATLVPESTHTSVDSINSRGDITVLAGGSYAVPFPPGALIGKRFGFIGTRVTGD